MSNGRYDVIRPAAVSISPADDWQTVAIKAFDKAEDRRVREESEARAQGNIDREREDNLFNAKYTRAVADHENALREYELAINQIGKDNPEMLKAIQNKYSKEYLIPNRDGTFEKRYVVSDGVKRYTDEKIKSKSDFDSKVELWPEMTSAERIAAWPTLKKHNKYFNVDLSTEEEGYKRALSSRDNEKVLESISAFLPAGYDANRWEGAKKILLKDGEVSEAELKLIAQDMTKHISTRDAARKFWTDFNTEIVKAMSDVKLDTPPSVVANLQRMQEMATQNLSEFYPGMSGIGQKGSGESENEIGDKISQSLFGKNFNELTDEEMQKVFEEYNKPTESGVVTRAGVADITKGKKKKVPLEEKVKSGIGYKFDKWIDPEGEKGAPLGKMVKDPVTGKTEFAQNIAINIRNNPYKYAKKGIIPTEGTSVKDFPWFKEVSVKEALMHWRESQKEKMSNQPIGIAPQPIDMAE